MLARLAMARDCLSAGLSPKRRPCAFFCGKHRSGDVLKELCK